MMKWNKLGLLFVPDGEFPWMHSHASNPFAVKRIDKRLRVYFTARNLNNQSHIGFVDLDPEQNFRVTAVSPNPVIEPGELGMFDDSGTAMGFLLPVNGKEFLYYLGWNLKVTVPWLNSIGLAVWDEQKKKFVKYSRAPIIDRNNEDPFSVSYPSILFENGIYRMWYGSNKRWGKNQSDMEHVIKYAESIDGISWSRDGKVIIDLEHENEYALSKPFVLKDHLYRMWYSYRANGAILTYRIGYAESEDGFQWIRKDNQVGIDISSNGWDSEMICYPFVFDHNGSRYMLYNGNGYGKTGFGIAIAEK